MKLARPPVIIGSPSGVLYLIPLLSRRPGVRIRTFSIQQVTAFLSALLLGFGTPAQAQMEADSGVRDSLSHRARAHPIRPLAGLVALGGLAAISLLDQPIHRATQQRNADKDEVAQAFRHMGQPEVFATVGLGTIAVGLIAGNDKIAMSGVRISSAVLLAGAGTQVVKRLVGRARPYQTDHAWQFRPFDFTYDAFPSGHTAVAFALATSISDEVHNTVVSIALYTAATGTAWSRLNDDKHWFSDVVGGALAGFASAKFVNGRWRVFGISGPHILLGPGGGGASVTLPLPRIR